MEPLTDLVIAQQIVDDISGEFSAYTAEQIEPYVAEARLSASQGFWTSVNSPLTPFVKYDLAVKYLTMHIIYTLRYGGAGASGQVTSRSAGELSESYAAPTGYAYMGVYSTTPWGRRYMELLATMRLSAMVV